MVLRPVAGGDMKRQGTWMIQSVTEIVDGFREDYGGMINKSLRRAKVCLSEGTDSV